MSSALSAQASAQASASSSKFHGRWPYTKLTVSVRAESELPIVKCMAPIHPWINQNQKQSLPSQEVARAPRRRVARTSQSGTRDRPVLLAFFFQDSGVRIRVDILPAKRDGGNKASYPTRLVRHQSLIRVSPPVVSVAGGGLVVYGRDSESESAWSWARADHPDTATTFIHTVLYDLRPHQPGYEAWHLQPQTNHHYTFVAHSFSGPRNCQTPQGTRQATNSQGPQLQPM